MRLGLVFALGMAACLSPVAAQECPALAPLPPAGTISGSLGAGSCLLTDGSAYTSYRLDLPTRGRLAIELGGSTDLQLILRDSSGTKLDAGRAIRRPLETGSYRLLVNGKTPGITGPFTITTSFVAEPGMLCANFPAMGLRQTLTNVLGNYGCTAPDGTAYDAWSITTLGAGTLTVNVASEDFTPTLVLRGTDGRALANSTDGVLAAPLMGDSQYLLVVASAGKGGSYQLKTDFQSAPDETCRFARSLTLSENHQGIIDSDSCYATVPSSGDRQYYSYYPLTLDAAGVAAFSVTSGDFAPTLYLLDEAGNTLAVDSLGGGYDTSGKARSQLRVPLPPGNYLMQVFSDLASGGGYQMQYTYQPEALTPCIATPAAPGDVKSGALSPASCRTEFGLTDLYAFTMKDSGTLELTLEAMDFPAMLAVRDPKDNLLVRSDRIDGVTGGRILADLPSGVYTVAASARSYAGAYRLASKFVAHDVPSCGFTQAINLNGGFVQRLNAASCKSAGGQPVDYYGFTLSADSLALGVVTSSEVDGYLTLLDYTGAVLRTDDYSYGGVNPLIVQYLPAGSYKLAVRDASGGDGGLYQVDLRTVEGTRPPFCAARGTLSLDSSVDGIISYTGCQDNGVFADLYQINLTADTTVDFQLSSSDFNAYLMVLDAKGNMLEEDDDSGGDTRSRITISLAAGSYYLIAKPFGDYRQHGAYTLTARTAEQEAPPK